MGEERNQPSAGPPPGWYVDPWGKADQRYWDGTRWSEHVREKASRKPSSWSDFTDSRVRFVAGCGGAGLVVAPFLPWVNVIFIGDLNLFQLLRAGGHSGGLAWLAVAIGAGVATSAYLHPNLKTVRRAALAAGLLAGAYSAIALTRMVDDVEKAEGLARMSWGPFLAVAGCVAMVVAALLKDKTPR